MPRPCVSLPRIAQFPPTRSAAPARLAAFVPRAGRAHANHRNRDLPGHHGVRAALNRIATQSGLRNDWQAACQGCTGIDAFDHRAQELVTTGYLHNHARRGFASIWIFTLRLPWELGADFFLRHLLDGDPASNTLSWRWVGGLHTPGKTDLASADPIADILRGLPLHGIPLARALRPPDARLWPHATHGFFRFKNAI